MENTAQNSVARAPEISRFSIMLGQNINSTLVLSSTIRLYPLSQFQKKKKKEEDLFFPIDLGVWRR